MQTRLLVNAAVAVITACAAVTAQAQSPDYYSGLYGGLEGGAISYNTQITFDGVDDPAGRGGVGYGAFLGYNHRRGELLVGAELLFNEGLEPDPYTFDPATAGFAELDVLRGASIGLDVRAGYLVGARLLLYGSLGYSANEQLVRIDGVALERIAGGAPREEFGALQIGGGLEFAIHPRVGLRTSFRSLSGHDLDISDFGTVPTVASLTHFDVKPSQGQFLTGLSFRF